MFVIQITGTSKNNNQTRYNRAVQSLAHPETVLALCLLPQALLGTSPIAHSLAKPLRTWMPYHTAPLLAAIEAL